MGTATVSGAGLWRRFFTAVGVRLWPAGRTFAWIERRGGSSLRVADGRAREIAARMAGAVRERAPWPARSVAQRLRLVGPVWGLRDPRGRNANRRALVGSRPALTPAGRESETCISGIPGRRGLPRQPGGERVGEACGRRRALVGSRLASPPAGRRERRSIFWIKWISGRYPTPCSGRGQAGSKKRARGAGTAVFLGDWLQDDNGNQYLC